MKPFMVLIAIVVIFLVVSPLLFLPIRTSKPPVTLIGDTCGMPETYGDETYMFNRTNKLTCMEMHPVKMTEYTDMGFHFVVYLPGSHATIMFPTREDAIKWADEQPLIVDPKQVR